MHVRIGSSGEDDDGDGITTVGIAATAGLGGLFTIASLAFLIYCCWLRYR